LIDKMFKKNNKNMSENYFKFSKENMSKVNQTLKKYPLSQKSSAVMPLLDIAMRQSGGWIPDSAMHEIASIINVPYIRVYEVASFYSMFNLQPIGKYFIQVCTTTPCWLRGSDSLVNICKKHLTIDNNETSQDGLFTLKTVECLGACVNAPMVQINDNYYEDLTDISLLKIIENLKKGLDNKVGSQLKNRKGGEALNVK
tara:strand:- start:203 stop:799 length:597 start_codon:yes stop_codon:yes gene_type:complete